MHDEPTDAPAWNAPRATGPLDAVVELPGSKSLTARALVLAAIAAGPSTLTGVLRSRDTELMIAALTTLGARIVEDGSPTRLRVTPAALPFPVSQAAGRAGGADGDGAPARIDCGLAGTVMRFIPPLAALADAPVLLDGDEAARARPLGPLLDAVASLGARVDYQGEPGFLPVLITPGALGVAARDTGAEGPGTGPRPIAVDSSASSQFLSALLLTAPLLPGGARITPTGPVPSLPHVAMTVASLRERGVDVEEPAPSLPEGERAWTVAPGRPTGGEVAIEPDLSNAGPFLAAAMVTGGRVRIPAWPGATTQAGDAWRALLGHMGATITLDEEGLTLSGPGAGNYPGIKATMAEVGELTPTLAAICAYASSPSHLSGIAHLRGHETDRLAALVAEINRAGGQAEETEDGLIITPRPLHAAQIRSYADHRMATFGAILGLVTPGITVDDIACTSKTLPGFEAMWASLVSADGPGSAPAAPASSVEEEQ